LRVIRCPTLQVSQFLFPGQRSDTFLTDHVYMYVRTYVFVRMYLLRTYVRMYVCMYACMYAYMCIYIYICLYVRRYVCIYVSMYVFQVSRSSFMQGFSPPLQEQLSVASRNLLAVWHAWQSNKILDTKRNLNRQIVRHTHR